MKFKISENDWLRVKEILNHDFYKNKKYEIVIEDLDEEEKGFEFTEIDKYTNYSTFIISEETEEEVIEFIDDLEGKIKMQKS